MTATRAHRTRRILTIVRCTVNLIVVFPLGVPKQEHFEALTQAVAAGLRRERIRRGMSMNAVAERGGLSQQMVSYVERGLRNPTLDTLFRIAIALELDLADVIAAAQRRPRRSR